MEPTDVAKTISIVLLSVVTLILGLIPIPIARSLNWKNGGKEMSSLAKNILSGLLCFGAGVLMATALIHLLPEVHDGMETLRDNGTVNSELPLAEIILGAGFFLVYLVEEVVHMISDRHAHNKTDVSIHRSVGVRECSISREGQPMPPCHQPSEEEEDGKCRAASICTVVDSSHCDEQVFCRDVTEPSVATISISNGDHHHYDDDEKSVNRRKSSVHHHHHHHHDLSDGDSVLPSVRGLLVILGLSIHELFEGIAIGLESDPESVWALFAAVATHKFVIAFCIGLEMATSGVRLSLQVFYMLVLAAVTSLGIGIGMLLIDGESTSLALTTLVLQGLAAGTLVYVAFFEVLERERSKSNIKLLQWTTLALGFLALIGMEALLPGHEHDHDHDHDHTESTISSVTEFIDSF